MEALDTDTLDEALEAGADQDSELEIEATGATLATDDTDEIGESEADVGVLDASLMIAAGTRTEEDDDSAPTEEVCMLDSAGLLTLLEIGGASVGADDGMTTSDVELL